MPSLIWTIANTKSVQLKLYLPAQCTKQEKKKRKNKISQFEMHFTASSANIRPYRNFNAVLHC